MKKIGCVVLACIMCGTMIGVSACGRVDNNPQGKVDSSKTALFVYNYDGGVGSEWVYDIERRFEEDYKDVEFEPGSGKVGVDVVISKGKDTVFASLSTKTYHVVFTEAVPVYTMQSSGDLLPITDLVTSSLSDVTAGAETATIESKLTDSRRAMLTAIDGNYYMLPHYETYAGLTYDVKVFEDYSFFIKQGGGWTSVDSEKTVGPDGERGTYDDGLPSSYEELLSLMDRCASLGVAPFIWTGGYETYTNKLLSGLDASFAGADEYQLNYTFDGGTARIITGFDDGTPIVEEIEITPENGYLMKQAESRYYALKVFEKIMSNSKYYSDKITGVLSHLEAQGEFIYGDLENAPIGMLIEGSYWYNEAADYFKRSIATYKDKAKNRKFAWMPLPVQITGSVEEGQGEKPTLVDANSSYAFINATTTKNDENMKALSKLFLKYCYTNKSLQDFVLTTGVFKGATVDLSGIDISALDYYKQSVVQIRQDANILVPGSAHRIAVNNYVMPQYDWESVVNNTTPYSHPIYAFKSKVSAEDVFMGQWLTQKDWNDKNGDYFN